MYTTAKVDTQAAAGYKGRGKPGTTAGTLPKIKTKNKPERRTKNDEIRRDYRR